MTDPDSKIVPFRWDLARREQLGGLLGGELAEVPAGYHQELREICTKVVARAGDSDLVFIGRSPEHLFDYLSGSFAALGEERPLTLLQFSKAYYGPHWRRPGWPRDFNAAERTALLGYLGAERIDPSNLASVGRPVRFVDLVSSGNTFLTLLDLLRAFTVEQRADWNVVAKRIGFIGITMRQKNSPNTVRWQQSDQWRETGAAIYVKNVSASHGFWRHCGDNAEKVTPSHHRGRWTDPDSASPARSETTLKALRRSVDIYDRGASADERRHLAQALANEPEFREPWLRKLALELKTTAKA